MAKLRWVWVIVITLYIYIYIYIYCSILNKSWRQHSTKQRLYGHRQLITKTIQGRRTRHAGHCWRSWDELISDVLLWAPSHGRAKAERPARTYVQQLCANTGCSLEDLSGAMDDRDGWRERVREIRAGGVARWYIYIYIVTRISIGYMLFSVITLVYVRHFT